MEVVQRQHRLGKRTQKAARRSAPPCRGGGARGRTIPPRPCSSRSPAQEGASRTASSARRSIRLGVTLLGSSWASARLFTETIGGAISRGRLEAQGREEGVELWWSAVVELGSNWSREGEVRGRRSPGRRGWGTPAAVTVTFCSRGGSKF